MCCVLYAPCTLGLYSESTSRTQTRVQEGELNQREERERWATDVVFVYRHVVHLLGSHDLETKQVAAHNDTLQTA